MLSDFEGLAVVLDGSGLLELSDLPDESDFPEDSDFAGDSDLPDESDLPEDSEPLALSLLPSPFEESCFCGFLPPLP